MDEGVECMAETVGDASGPSQVLRRNVPALSLSSFVMALGNGLWLSLFSIYLDGLGVSPLVIGLVLTSYNGAMSIVYLPSGRLSDLVGRRTPLLAGCFIIVVATPLLYLARSAESIMPLLVVVGLGQGLMGPASTALVAESVASRRSGFAFSVYMIAGTCGGMVGSATGGLLASSIGYRSLFVIAALLGGLSLAILYMFVQDPSTRWRGRLTSAVHRTLRESLSGTVSLLRSKRDLLYLAVALCFHTFGLSMINPYVSLFAQRAVKMTIAEAGFMLSFQSLGLIVAQIPFGQMTDRFGARAVLLAHFALSSLSWSLYGMSSSALIAYLTVFFFGVIGAMDMPARRTLMVEYASATAGKATVIGSLDAIIGLAGIAAPTVGGLAWGGVGYTAPFHLAAVLNVGASIPLLLLLRRRRRNTSP